MDLKKFAKIVYLLLMLFAVVLTINSVVDIFPTGTWMVWVVSILGIFVGIFGDGIKHAPTIVILFIGLFLTYNAFSGLDYIGEYITMFLSNVIFVTAPIVLTLIGYKFSTMFKKEDVEVVAVEE
ncbi:MAG: hypothetical protein ABFS32_23110 [Bacteroidota bacterium]